MAHAPLPKLSLTWADVLLVTVVLLLGLGAWIAGERWVAPLFEQAAPVQERFEGKHQVAARRAELAAAERTLAVLEERLREQRLEDMRQRAVITAWEALYPQLRGARAASAPTEARSGYVSAKMAGSATQGFLQALEHDVARQDSTVSRARRQVGVAGRAAADELAEARRRHAMQRRWLDLGAGAVLAVVALLALWAAAPWLARRLEVPVQRGLSFRVGGALLLMLVAYHLFQRAGAVAAGMLLGLILLVAAVRRGPARPAAEPNPAAGGAP